ncbi:MAG: twin-arginine translocase subunit TatC [Actinobacteria bacterium]|nr:twin-arginine translocase subunit TatC [Actinomycetota bacterium]
MTIVEHLTELRKRLVISVVAVGVASIAGFVFFDTILGWVKEPYCDALQRLPEIAPPGSISGGGCRLYFGSVAEPFVIRLKIALFTGLAIALPIVLFQLWRFITPGLTKRERRLGLPFVAASVVLFAMGGALAFWTLPKALEFLLGFAGNIAVPLITLEKYVSFLILVIMAFGLSFEFPILLIFLAAARVVTTQQLRRWRRNAILGITVFAALITPSQDPYTMLGMMVPLVLFYELSILVARLLNR